MLRQKTAPGSGPGAAGLRRGGVALPLAHILAQPAENCKPPGHLTSAEAELWRRAAAARGNGDRQRFWNARRELLLEQSRRYEPAR